MDDLREDQLSQLKSSLPMKVRTYLKLFNSEITEKDYKIASSILPDSITNSKGQTTAFKSISNSGDDVTYTRIANAPSDVFEVGVGGIEGAALADPSTPRPAVSPLSKDVTALGMLEELSCFRGTGAYASEIFDLVNNINEESFKKDSKLLDVINETKKAGKMLLTGDILLALRRNQNIQATNGYIAEEPVQHEPSSLEHSPLLIKYCANCHAPNEKKPLPLDSSLRSFIGKSGRYKGMTVKEIVESDLMPRGDEKEALSIKPEDRKALLEFLSKEP